MGQKCAPTCVTMVMAYLEMVLMEKASEKFGNNNKDYIERHWKRFLNDCFIPRDLNIASLEEFHDLLNSLHPQIKFAKNGQIQKSTSWMFQWLQERMVRNNIFYISTDSFNYVPFQSGDSCHTKANIPVNLARRLKTVVSEDKKL